MRTGLIAGATGLVGNELLGQMLEDSRYTRVVVVSRRDFPISHPKLQKIVVDFDDLETVLADVRVDDVFCCLGTTMAAVGTRDKFYRVDFEYPVALARITRAAGATRYFLVSALGAKRGSIIYYNRVKGESEEAIRAVGFPVLHIFRPSLLLGDRKEKRAGEDAAKKLYRTFGFLIPRKYKAIEARSVARAMLASTFEEQSGVFVHESAEMHQYD